MIPGRNGKRRVSIYHEDSGFFGKWWIGKIVLDNSQLEIK